MFFKAAGLSLLAGSAIFFGALLASADHLRKSWKANEFHHTVTAFGGGALLSAVALVLVPEGVKHQPTLSTAATFLSGGLVFLLLERFLASRKTAASQMVAMMLDFVPEAVVIGAIITKAYEKALLMAAIIFIQNLPESFNAFREMKESTGMKSRKMLFWFLAAALTGPLYVLIGTEILREHFTALDMLMTFCAGGILYIVFNDIAPQAKLKKHWLPAMGALLGFVIGVIGESFLR